MGPERDCRDMATLAEETDVERDFALFYYTRLSCRFRFTASAERKKAIKASMMIRLARRVGMVMPK